MTFSSKGKARIIGLGSYLPEKIMTNQDLEKIVDTTDDWIVSRTGIKERRIAAPGQVTSDLGMLAAKTALEKAGLKALDIDMIIVATMSPDYISPSTAAIVQAKLGATRAAAMDVQAACTGFLYGLSMAKAYVESGMYQNVLLIAAEKMSSILDYSDRTTCVIFGDGASAVVLSNKGKGFEINTICLGADGTLADKAIIPAGGSFLPASSDTVANKLHYFKMDGKEIFKHAVRRMGQTAKDCLDKAGLTEDKVSWLIPHQANERIIDAIAKSFNIASERVYKTIHKYGNTSASSIAIALDDLVSSQPINVGENLLLIAFGGGLTWGASVLTKVSE